VSRLRRLRPAGPRQQNQAASRKPQAASRKSQAASRKPQAASRKPQAASRKPQAASRKPQAASRKPQAASGRKSTAGGRKSIWGALGRVREAHALKFGCVRLRFAKDFLPGFFLVIFWSADRFFGLGRFGESWGALGKRKKVPGRMSGENCSRGYTFC
jgi:hypothetical protein